MEPSTGKTGPSTPRPSRPTEPRRTSRDLLIPADKRGWPRHAVHGLIRWKLREHFHRILVQRLDATRSALEADPSGLLLVANHSNWWDFFMAHWLNVSVPWDGYGMTEWENMRKFGFFKRIGAFSVDRTRPAAIRASLDYTIERLRRPRRAVWFFPQGRILCNDLRPIRFEPGLRALLKRAGRLRILPVALRYDYWQEERPEAFARFGSPAWVDRAEAPAVLSRFEARLTEELDLLTADALTQDLSKFEPILSGRGSTHDRYARIRSRLGLGPPQTADPRDKSTDSD